GALPKKSTTTRRLTVQNPSPLRFRGIAFAKEEFMNRALVCSLAVVGLVFCSTAGSYADEGQKDDKAKKNEAKLREKEKERAEKDARRYEKLKAFAINLYQTN